MDALLLNYLLFCFFLSITPGADMALVTRNVLQSEAKGGIVTSAGICLGLLVYALLTASGLSYVLTKYPHVFVALKYGGAGYLLFLGAKAVKESLTPMLMLHAGRGQDGHAVRYGKFFAQGFLTNMLNPKVLMFYASILPQFLPAHQAGFAEIFKLALLQISIGMAWLMIYSFSIDKINFLLKKPRVNQVIQGITGLLMIGFGLKVLLVS